MRWFDALNSRDDARIDQLVEELVAHDYILYDPGFPSSIRGQGGVRQFAHELIQNNSLVQIVIEDLICDGDRLAYRGTITTTSAKSGKTVPSP